MKALSEITQQIRIRPEFALAGLFFSLAAVPGMAQQTTGVPCSPSATTTIDGKYLPSPPPPFGGVINLSATDSKPCWPPTRGAAQGCAQRAADHDRRPGLRRLEHLRRRHPDAGDGPGRQGGAALHAVPFHRALLAHAGGADHRTQPSLGGLWRDHRAVHRLSGLRLHHRTRTTQPSARF